MRKIIKYLTVLSLLFSTAEASVIGISIHDTSVVQGQIFLLPVYVDSSLTGQNVTSFQLQLGFSGSILAFDSVTNIGTLSQSFGTPTFNSGNPNQVSIAGAGSSPLAGIGVLVYVRFRAVGTGYSAAAFSDAAHNLLNEGDPGLIWRSGSVTVQPAPSIGVSPNNALLTVGDSLLFSAYGGTAPYHWALTNGPVASIDSTGLLKAIHSGLTRVIATDNSGIIDTSGIVEIRAFCLSIHDTSALQGRTFDLPVYTTDLTGLNVTSGSMQMTFNASILTPVSVTQSGSLLLAYSPAPFNTKTPGQVNISFAGTSPLEGKGVLFFVRFAVSPTNSGGTSVSLGSVLFDENLPGNVSSGNFSIIVPPPVYISPSTANLVVRDTIRFYASNGTPPYVWSTTDTTIAQVDSFGLVTARRNGIVRIVAHDSLGSSGSTGDIHVYNAFVSIREISGKGPGTIDEPIAVDRLSSGGPVSSLQLTIVYDTSVVQAVGIVTTGTLIEGWSNSLKISGNHLTLAAAGAAGFQSTGTLAEIRFQVASNVNYGQRAYVNFQQLLLNEGTPSVLTVDGGVTVVTAPLPPQLYSPANGLVGQPTTLTFSWYGSAYADTYRLQVAADSTFDTIVADDSMLTSTQQQVGPLANNMKYYWRVSAGNAVGMSAWSTVWWLTTSVTGVGDHESLPRAYNLNQNYPNPFNPTTQISYALPANSRVNLNVYDVLGQVAATLVDEAEPEGIHSAVWDARSAASGVYYYRLNATSLSEPRKSFVQVKKMLLIR